MLPSVVLCLFIHWKVSERSRLSLVSGEQTNKHGDYGVVPAEHSM